MENKIKLLCQQHAKLVLYIIMHTYKLIVKKVICLNELNISNNIICLLQFSDI